MVTSKSLHLDPTPYAVDVWCAGGVVHSETPQAGACVRKQKPTIQVTGLSWKLVLCTRIRHLQIEVPCRKCRRLHRLTFRLVRECFEP